MIVIDNLLNNHYLTQMRLDDLMLLTKHKLKTKPQDKSFCLHVRGCWQATAAYSKFCR